MVCHHNLTCFCWARFAFCDAGEQSRLRQHAGGGPLCPGRKASNVKGGWETVFSRNNAEPLCFFGS
eukprot:6231966-Amphidinium_carterae.1